MSEISNPVVGQAAAGVSAFLGILVIAFSSKFLSDWREPYDDCKVIRDFYDFDICKPLRYFVTGAATGIVAGFIQALSSVLGFIKKGKIWVGVQILVVILLICAYAVPVSQEAYNIETMDGYRFIHRWSSIAFLGVVSTDIACMLILMLFTLLAS